MYEPWSPSDLKPEIPRHHILNKEFELHKKTQKPLLGTTKADVTLELYDNQMWTGEFLMGGDQVVDLVYDTGSAWLVVTSVTCENCLGTNYDHSLAPNFKQLTTDKSSLTYGSAHIEGYTAVDDAKISKDMGLKNFPFFDVVAQQGFGEFMDGILGMARTFYSGTMSSGPVYHDYLKERGEILQNVFGFYLGNDNEQSVLQIGSYSNSYMRNAAELVWLDLEYNYFWYSECDAYRVGDSDPGVSYTPQPVIFDTGTTYAYLPTSLYDDFTKKIMKGQKYYKESGVFVMNMADVE